MTDTRLNKAIADHGYCSRRKADELIDAGKVTVNGEPAQTGQRVSSSDVIAINGKPLAQKAVLTIMMNKPAGLVTSKGDPHNQNTVMSVLPKEWQHLKPAGRLDKDSEGLLILSSDGDFIQKLTHPKNGHTKTYEIVVKGHPRDEQLEPLYEGKLRLDGYTLNPMVYKIQGRLKGGKTRIRLILTEGRNRQIRRIMDQIGFPVIYLRRIGIGKLALDDLPLGESRELTPSDLSKALA